jgi:hypothetical protein
MLMYVNNVLSVLIIICLCHQARDERKYLLDKHFEDQKQEKELRYKLLERKDAEKREADRRQVCRDERDHDYGCRRRTPTKHAPPSQLPAGCDKLLFDIYTSKWYVEYKGGVKMMYDPELDRWYVDF